jgi:hypothetical protein
MAAHPLPVIADVFRTTLNWTNVSVGTPAANVLHFKTSSSGKSEQEVFDCLDAHVVQAMWDWAAVGSHVATVDIIKLDGASGTHTFTTGNPAKWSGGGTGEPLPQVAGLLKLQTGLRGRSKRGRIYIPFVGEGETLHGDMADADLVGPAWTTFANAIASDATTPTALGVASYKNADWNQATSIVAEIRSATQRRRQHR